MEADLARYYQLDYRDRWRLDNGRPRLTLRRLWVLLRKLPPDSSLITALNGGDPGWTRLEVLVTDVWSALAGKEHPGITRASTDAQGHRIKSAEQLAKIEAARARYAKRRRRIAAGEIT